MKVALILAISIISSSSSYGQTKTQSQLTSRYGNVAIEAEKRMDSIYNKILSLYSKDTLFLVNLKSSQNFWLKYFAAQESAMYPRYPSGHYGSMLSMCVSEYAKKLIETRTRELESWLIGTEDGDCSSSIKPKDELPR